MMMIEIFLANILTSLSRNLQTLSLYGDTCILQDDGILDSTFLSQVDQGGKKLKEYVNAIFSRILKIHCVRHQSIMIFWEILCTFISKIYFSMHTAC